MAARDQELNGILHRAFSHPEATDDSAQVVGTPRLVQTADGWYVTDENETRFNLVSCMRPDPRHGYYKLVPEYDPTPEMEKAFWDAYRKAADDAASPWPTQFPDLFGEGYCAMVKAAASALGQAARPAGLRRLWCEIAEEGYAVWAFGDDRVRGERAAFDAGFDAALAAMSEAYAGAPSPPQQFMNTSDMERGAGETLDQKSIERAWRDAGLAEWFLGNGGTNLRLYDFAARSARSLQPSPRRRATWIDRSPRRPRQRPKPKGPRPERARFTRARPPSGETPDPISTRIVA